MTALLPVVMIVIATTDVEVGASSVALRLRRPSSGVRMGNRHPLDGQHDSQQQNHHTSEHCHRHPDRSIHSLHDTTLPATSQRFPSVQGPCGSCRLGKAQRATEAPPTVC